MGLTECHETLTPFILTRKWPDKPAIRDARAARRLVLALDFLNVVEGAVVDVAGVAFVGVDVHGEADNVVVVHTEAHGEGCPCRSLF
jgi:hypothetical protein